MEKLTKARLARIKLAMAALTAPTTDPNGPTWDGIVEESTRRQDESPQWKQLHTSVTQCQAALQDLIDRPLMRLSMNAATMQLEETFEPWAPFVEQMEAGTLDLGRFVGSHQEIQQFGLRFLSVAGMYRELREAN